MKNGGNLKSKDKIRIIGFNCGKCAQQRFCHMGIVCGRDVTIETIQPFDGPVTVECLGTKISIGRGMFNKLEYEVIE